MIHVFVLPLIKKTRPGSAARSFARMAQGFSVFKSRVGCDPLLALPLMEIDHGIISIAILSLLLIQEGSFSYWQNYVRIALVNCLEGGCLPRNSASNFTDSDWHHCAATPQIKQLLMKLGSKYDWLDSPRNLKYKQIWAVTWQNQKSDCAPSEVSDQPGHPPSQIRVFAVRMTKAWVLSYPLSAQPMPRLTWVFAGRKLILSWHGSYTEVNICKLLKNPMKALGAVNFTKYALSTI